MKQYHRYQMEFTAKSLKASLACMAVGIFMLFVYFIGWTPLWKVKAVDWIFSFGLPVAAGIAFIVLARFKRLNAPGVYAILGAVLCLCLLIGSFSSGSVIRIILSILAYLLCGATLVFVAGGMLPGKLPASLFLGITLAVRLAFFDLTHIRSVNWIREIAVLAILLSLTLLPAAFREIKKA